jgi:chitin disaccharide deacetylase
MRPDHAGSRSQRRILVCADDFGHSHETSRVILDLLDRGKLNGTSCLVEGGAWVGLGGVLRQLANARPAVAVGLHLNLTERFVQHAPGSLGPPNRVTLARLLMTPGSGRDNALYQRLAAQWDLFVRYFGREPDFVDGHQHVHLAPSVRKPLMHLLATKNFSGWIRQCRTSSNRLSPKRMLLDRLSRQFERKAIGYDAAFNPGFGGLRRFDEAERVTTIWHTDLAAMPTDGVLMVHPGADASGCLADPLGRFRLQEARLLAGDAMREALEASGFSLDQPTTKPATELNSATQRPASLTAMDVIDGGAGENTWDILEQQGAPPAFGFEPQRPGLPNRPHGWRFGVPPS